MNVDHTELLKALKHPQPEPTDEEKRENGLHDWLTKKEPEK